MPRKKTERMQPVTIRLPAELIDALNQATVDEDRPSASEEARAILIDYLRTNGYLSDESYPEVSTNPPPDAWPISMELAAQRLAEARDPQP